MLPLLFGRPRFCPEFSPILPSAWLHRQLPVTPNVTGYHSPNLDAERAGLQAICSDTKMPLSPADKLGPYNCIAPIGKGGMWKVPDPG